MNLYFYGGSFNPPHLGHKEIIEYFSRKGDKLLVIPTYHSPLKTIKPISYSHREKMLELMFRGNTLDGVSIVDYELETNSPYTADLIKFIKSKFPSYNINMIIGCDQLNSIEEWKNYGYIINNVNLTVISRPNFNCESRFSVNEYIDDISVDISSSFIRENINNIDVLSDFMDKDVINYIITNKLYV